MIEKVQCGLCPPISGLLKLSCVQISLIKKLEIFQKFLSGQLFYSSDEGL